MPRKFKTSFKAMWLLATTLAFAPTLFAESAPPPRPTCDIYPNCPVPAQVYVVETIGCPPTGVGKVCTQDLPPARISCNESNDGVFACEATPQRMDVPLQYTWFSSRADFRPDGADSPMQNFSCVRGTASAITVVVADNLGRSTQAEIDVMCRVGNTNVFDDPPGPTPSDS
jgi:hypothetical protein